MAGIDLFGWRIEPSKAEKPLPSFTDPEHDDGALVVSAGGVFGTFVDLEGTAKNEAELITKYREMYNQPECQLAVDEITNEAIVKEANEVVVEIVLDGLDQPKPVIEAITKEWGAVSKLLDLNNSAYNIFQRWFIDGRVKYNILIDEANPREGIKECRYIDPRKIQKVRTVQRVRQGKVYVNQKVEEFYVYNERGFKGSQVNAPQDTLGNQGLKIASDVMVDIPSGLTDSGNKMVLSYMHKAIKPLNMLRMLEDATVIYKIARAPQKRIFYIEVGNLPKAKAEQHLKDMANKHKNRLIYDPVTGNISDDRKFQTMLEDMWFPRRSDGKATEVTTLPGDNDWNMEPVNYFKRKLFEALDVPMSRLEPNTGILGRSSEISRDELKFQKFINRLRLQFSKLFIEILGKQLVLKGIVTLEDWKEFKNDITFEFSRDNYFAELKDAEIWTERLTLLGIVDEYEGKYFSKEWIQTNVLKLSEDEIKEMDEQIKEESVTDPTAGAYQDYAGTGGVDPDTTMGGVPPGPDTGVDQGQAPTPLSGDMVTPPATPS